MDAAFDILVNISPLTLICNIYFIYKIYKEKKRYWVILGMFAYLLVYIAFRVAGLGYGFFSISILLFIFATIFYVILAIICVKKKLLYLAMSNTACIIYLIKAIRKRFEIEGVTVIELIVKINFYEIFLSITQNEWFKGITIASSGGIISGLVLKKIFEKNNSKNRDENEKNNCK